MGRGKYLTTAFDYTGKSIWTRDKKMKRFNQGDKFTKIMQDKRDINEKNQVFIYSKALSRKTK